MTGATGTFGSSALRLDRPKLAYRRLTVATLRLTAAAMWRIGMRARRSCSMRAASSPPTVLRVFTGRELRSSKPSRPSCSKRSRHLRAVHSSIVG